jgi:hypothetical protein
MILECSFFIAELKVLKNSLSLCVLVMVAVSFKLMLVISTRLHSVAS